MSDLITPTTLGNQISHDNGDGTYSQVVYAENSGSTSTKARIATSTTSVTAVALNLSREELVIYNDSTSVLYVRYGTSAATTTSFSFRLNPGETLIEDRYTGDVTMVLDTGTGNAQVTEVS